MRSCKKLINLKIIFILFIVLQFANETLAQNNESINNHDSIITTSRKMMETAQLCALITIDDNGYPSARIMDPFIPDDDMIVWLGTNLNSKKIKEIKNNSSVALYYQSPSQAGYVALKGQALIVNDAENKQKYWKPAWNRFYEKDKSNFTLIKIIPEKLEIIDYQKGIIGDPNTWEAPFVIFSSTETN